MHSALIGCNDFNNLILPGCWWRQILILRHIYKIKYFLFPPFRPRLPSNKVCKKCKYDFFNFSQMQNGYQKKENFMLISNPLKKLQKYHSKNCYHWKIDRKNWVFDFYFRMQRVFGYAFLGFFWWFFAFYDTHIKFLKKYFAYIGTFANFKAKIGRNGSKKLKSCLRISYDIYCTSGLGGSIFSKKIKIKIINAASWPPVLLLTSGNINCWQEYTYTEHALSLNMK